MLAYDHSPPVHPWMQGVQLPDSSDPRTLHFGQQDYSALASGQALDPQTAAYALSALSQSPNSMDASMLQSVLLQGNTHQGVSSSAPDFSHLLAQLPTPPGLHAAASSPKELLQTPGDHTSSPLQFDAASAMAVGAQHWAQAATSQAAAITQEQAQPSAAPRVFVPESLKPASASAPDATNPQLLLQALLGMQQQQPAAAAATDSSASLLPLLQEQMLLQALQQQNAAAAQPNMQAALAAALSAGAGAPPGLGQQHLTSPIAAALAASTPGNMWPLTPPGLTDATGAAATAASATAAALLAAQQQQQQQAAVTRALASMGLAGGLDTSALLQQLLLSQPGLAGPAGSSAAASVLNQLQPWAVKALTTQLQHQSAGMNLAAFSQQQAALANLLNATTGTNTLPRPMPSAPLPRRSRTGRRSSGTAAAVADLTGSFGMPSRAGSVTGSDAADSKAGTGVPAVLPPGITAKDLCPTTFEDSWGGSGAADAAAGAIATSVCLSSAGSCKLARGGSSASSSSLDSEPEAAGSLCGSALSLSSGSRETSTAGGDDKWQWDSHFCSLDEDVAAKGSSGVSGRACRRSGAAAGGQEGEAAADEDTAAAKDQGDSKAGAAEGCAVWYPGAREAAGDDSWYLRRPPTCRLFVGNIGCWVDEAMLLGYFGKYGHVVDVQVMWNTKMLARGRRVNREFAFISYSSPLEAARAVHWLDGCRLADLEKDKNGVTVEYENGEGDTPAAK